ncbi:MAG: hypothetical protein D6732_09975 [Methanobacteriota archaeon]|nr:MAG: hypothetical protein D6732_09975 [Euryarchaeota archaeon]
MVVSEMWYPRWKAELDGKSIHIYKVNHAVRGIFVPAGEHQLVMSFDKHTFNRAVMFSWLGLSGMYIMILIGLGSIIKTRKQQ